MNMNSTSIATLISDLHEVLTEMLKAAPRSTSRRPYGIAFAAKRGIDILEREESIEDAIASFAECIYDDHYMIDSLGSISVRDEEYYRGRLAVDEDILGSLKTIKEQLNQSWMMTGIRAGKNHHRVKMWCVDAEDKRRIEANGNKVVGLHETYINIEFLPW
jgi:hypothetical protein